MSLLDLLGVNRIFKAGQPVDPTRKILNFIGDGVTIVDNPGSLRTDITIAGGGGSGDGTVSGPDTSTAGNVAVWAGVDGTELADGGRSVATDGAKLDGIEAGAQVTSFARVASALAAATADVAINAHKITGVANPTSAQDAATKAYVDAYAGGGVSGAAWTTAVETNFETVPAAPLVDGPNTVDGRVWQGVNIATGATSVSVGAAAAGLAIRNNTFNSQYDAAYRTPPLVTHPLTDSVPKYTAGTHELRLYGLLETNASRNYEFTRFGFETAPATPPTARCFWVSSVAFNVQQLTAEHHATGGGDQAVNARNDQLTKAFCILRVRSGMTYYYAKNVGTVLADTPTDSIFTDDLSTWTLDAVCSGPTAGLEPGGGKKVTNAASLSVVFASMTGNTAGLLNSRLRRVRLQWRLADAAGNLPAGSGDVVGPSSATADRLASFNGTTGKAIKDSGAKVADLATKADLVKGGWTAALDLNFTQLPAQTFVDGPNSYQGLTIYGRNIASSGAAVNVNANGLDVVHGNAVTDISATYTGPNVYLRLGDLIPSFQIGVTDVRIWLQYGAVTPSKNWQLAVFQVERLPDASGNRWWLGGWHGFDTAELREERYQTSTRIVVPPANNVQCLCLYALKTASLFSGPSAAADSAPNDAAFPLIEAMKPGSSGSFPTTGLARFDAAPLYMADRNAIGFAMGATAAANSAFTARFKRLQIKFRN